jgi:hypothetical protein
MTNLAAIHTDFRDIGDTTLAVYEDEFRRKGSPMLATARTTFDAACPMSALFLAQCGFENQYKTTGEVIKPEDNNPAALRPWPEDPRATKEGDVLDWKTRGKVGTMKVPPHAAGAIRASDGTYMLRFPSDADCAKEYRYRLQAGSPYKGGVYNRAKTLEQMLAIYAPSGDVHPVTGLDNADADYLGTVTALLTSFKQMEGETPAPGNLVDELTDTLTDIITGIGKGHVPHDPMAFDPAVEILPAIDIPYLDQVPKEQLTARFGRDHFFRVGRAMRAIRDTPRHQRAIVGSRGVIGTFLEKGKTAIIDWAWVTYDGHLWLLSDWDTRFYGADFVLEDGSPLPVPDPGPVVPDPKPQPPVPGTSDWMNVADPFELLPPIEWLGSPNFFPNRNGFGNPIAVANHITDDMNLSRVLGWLRNPASQASSHFVIDRDGKVCQLVSTKDGAFTNGDYAVNGVPAYRTDIPWLVDVIRRGINVNNACVTIEHVGTPSNPPTEAQYQASIKIHRYLTVQYGIKPHRGWRIRHGDVNKISRSYCPGPNFDQERIIRAVGGDPAKLA